MYIMVRDRPTNARAFSQTTGGLLLCSLSGFTEHTKGTCFFFFIIYLFNALTRISPKSSTDLSYDDFLKYFWYLLLFGKVFSCLTRSHTVSNVLTARVLNDLCALNVYAQFKIITYALRRRCPMLISTNTQTHEERTRRLRTQTQYYIFKKRHICNIRKIRCYIRAVLPL